MPTITATGQDASPAPLPGRRRARPLDDALAVLGVALVLLAGTEVGIVLDQGGRYPGVAAAFPLVGLGYVVLGLLAWRRRPSSRLGCLIVLGGVAILAAGLQSVDAPAPSAVGDVTQTTIFAVVLHLLLAFPTGRLRDRASRVVVVASYAVALVLQAPVYLLAPDGVLSIADRPGLADLGLEVQRVAGTAVVLATGALLVRRLRRADARQRRVLLPVSAYGISAVLLVPISSVVSHALVGDDLLWLGLFQLALVAVIPVAFVLAASRGGFERAGDVTELGAWLGADDAARPRLRDALATTLGDPTLQLLFRVDSAAELVDDAGAPTALPVADPARGVVEVTLGGRPVGVIVHDATALDRPEEVRQAGRVIALALERERLTVELLASRARIAAAADQERRRIARDLHDGLQSRLVFLAIQAGADPALEPLRPGLQQAIDELRALVDGVMPSALTERGLVAAVEDLRDRLPMPTALEVHGLEERLAPEVETGAYFVIAEAMVNAVKHAAPTALTVSLERTEDQLALEVRDDGSGGAEAGPGLSGMADRVHALGGRLAVRSSADDGTRVEVVIPCAS